MKLSDKIMYLRDKYNVSQKTLAKELEVSRQSVYKWEADLSIPELEKIKKIAQIFNVSFEDLLNDEIDIREKNSEEKIIAEEVMTEMSDEKTENNKKQKIIILTVLVTIIATIVVLLIIFLPKDYSDNFDTETQCIFHNPVWYKTEKEATCVEKGMEIYYCETCKKYDFVRTEALDHSFNSSNKCTRCEYIYIKGSYGIEYGIYSNYAFVKSIGNCKDKNIIIASEFNGYPVKVIRAMAFYESEIESVTLSFNIEKIESKAFKNCKNLKKIILNEGLKEIGVEAFSGCGKNEDVIIPNSVERIEAQAFLGTNIHNLRLGSNLNYIGVSAFYNCTLRGIIIFNDLDGWRYRDPQTNEITDKITIKYTEYYSFLVSNAVNKEIIKRK